LIRFSFYSLIGRFFILKLPIFPKMLSVFSMFMVMLGMVFPMVRMAMPAPRWCAQEKGQASKSDSGGQGPHYPAENAKIHDFKML
jgi:hypothetical protein